jgi:hypothetical protein
MYRIGTLFYIYIMYCFLGIYKKLVSLNNLIIFVKQFYIYQNAHQGRLPVTVREM